LGADVVKVPKAGLGQAYIDSIPYITGDYVVMGGADGTYDFKEIDPFIKKLDKGYEFVMGTRTKGWIEKGSRPALHQYFGAPITNWIFNLVYGSKFSDIHCGLRAMTRDAFERMRLQSTHWEYASEMIIKSMHLRLRTTEVPIKFYKDRHGRVPHLQTGFLTPWFSGWISLKAMFIFGANFFLYRPGILMMIVGFLAVMALTLGPIGRFSMHFMLLGLTIAILGFVAFTMGILASSLYDYSDKNIKKWLKVFEYNRSVIVSLVLFIAGIFLTYPLLKDYFQNNFALPFGIKNEYYSSVTGLLFIIVSFVNFTFSLLLHALDKRLTSENIKRNDGKLYKK